MRRSMRALGFQALLALAFLGGSSRLALADVFITVDEEGNGTLVNNAGFNFVLPFALKQDPGPGGRPNILTYDMLNPPALTAGDVLFVDPGGLILDVVRFNPKGTGGNPNYPASLLFYSDNVDGFDSLGDTPGPPFILYANQVRIPEVGPEGFNEAFYTPLPGQPGYVNAANIVSYRFISDVPEPASLLLLGTVAVGIVRRLRKAV